VEKTRKKRYKFYRDYHPKFEKKVKEVKELVESGKKPNASAGWKVPIELLLPLVTKCMLRGDEYVYFSLANGMEPLDVEGEHLLIMAYGEEDEIMWVEDLPPITEPPEGGG